LFGRPRWGQYRHSGFQQPKVMVLNPVFWFLAIALPALLGAGAVGAQGAGGAIEVDLELVLAVDVSGSMDEEEHAVQRAGYVAAIRHPDFARAIRTGAYQRLAVTYVEWAGPALQAIVMPWRVIEGEASARAFADELSARPITNIRGTSISGALVYSTALFEGNGYDGLRKVIDVSGDGPNRNGIAVDLARDLAVGRGIVINGLPIMIRPSRSFVALDRYYADCVIGGPGAFVLPVRKAEEIAEAIRRKLILDIAARPGSPAIPVQAPGPVDCRTGERIRRLREDY
jgi:hypothetical protein